MTASAIETDVYRNIPDGYALPVGFADNIKAIRKQLGLNQAEFGERLGVGQSAVSKWEQGLSVPDTPDARTIAAQLGRTVDQLMAGEPTGPETAGPPLFPAPATLLATEKRALRVFRQIDDAGQKRALDVLVALARAMPRRPVRRSTSRRK